MTRCIVLGAGRVGAVIAADLAAEPGFEVTVVDASAAAAERARARSGGRVEARSADLSDPAQVRALVEPYDVAVGALPSRFGRAALQAVLEARTPYVDISFMPEDARELDALAREAGVPAVVDFGVAPGMSHLLAAHGVRELGGAQRLRILVGGVPRERVLPFQYKAGFAPTDVIEEYTRPARLVERGRLVVRPALSVVERVNFPGLGTLEAGLTDGLRSLVHTLEVPEMVELTLRWPGHYDLIKAFAAAGLFSSDPIRVGGREVRPLDVTAALLSERWTYAPGEADLTVMRVEVEGGGRRIAWDVVDAYDAPSDTTSMARTTAFPCAIVARALADGSVSAPGVHPPEHLAALDGLVARVLSEHERRGVRYVERRETL